MQSQRLFFTNRQGEKLGARLDLPVDGQPLAYALFAHCFTCTKNLKAVANINQSLTRAGIAVLRFDFTGLGESEGDFADTNFSSNVADLIAAAEFLKHTYAAPQLLIGHSLGGAAVLQAAAHVPSAKCLVTIGSPYDPSYVAHLLASTREEIEATGQAEVCLAGRTFTIKQQFLDDLETSRMEEVVRNLHKALLIFHSPLDQTVGVDNAAQIFMKARHPKSFVSLDKADHLLTDETDSRYVGSVIATWALKYLALSTSETKAAESQDHRVVVCTDCSHYRTEIRASGHSLVADEPLTVGGTNLGPTPYDYLLAGLGACTSMTLRMYADRKGWPLEEVVVRLNHRKIHAHDCEACETADGKVDLIERDLKLIGPLDEAQRKRLLEIADKCPVHRTLTTETVVKTDLVV